MKRTSKPGEELNAAMTRHANRKAEPQEQEYEGNDIFVSSGSTLLDLAISGGRRHGGGIPGGILMEIAGPSGTGKTVLLCEIAGAVQRLGGDLLFKDPEARLNKQFASIFGLSLTPEQYETPDTVKEVFESIREWKPSKKADMHAVLADSLAALSTEMEMDGTDKYGMRRAREFSEECRKTCRVLTERGLLMVASNQLRANPDAGPYGQKYRTPGGEAIPFYASVRLRTHTCKKLTDKQKFGSKEVSKVVGVETEIEIVKNSVWKPYRSASVIIDFDYGIDDITANLRFLKTHTGATVYKIGDLKLGKSIGEAIEIVEDDNLEGKLREATISLWHEIEEAFQVQRKPKRREPI